MASDRESGDEGKEYSEKLPSPATATQTKSKGLPPVVYIV